MTPISREGGKWKIDIAPNDAVLRTISGANSNDGLIRLEGASGISIDGSFAGNGKYLKFVNNATSTTKSAVFKLSDDGSEFNVKNIKIQNSILFGSSNTVSNAYGIYIGAKDMNETTSVQYIDSVDINGNEISKAYKGIWATGGSGNNYNIRNLFISNNVIGSKKANENINSYGIRLNNAPKAQISNNEILNISSSNTNNVIGIEINRGCDSILVEKNMIHGIYSSYINYAAFGINIQNKNKNATIINNVIYDFKEYGATTSSAGVYHSAGIRLNGGDSHKLYYNSINLNGTFISNDTNCYTSALLISSNECVNLDIRNNVFANNLKSTNSSQTSQTYAVYTLNASTFSQIDNNCYFSANPNVLAYNGASLNTLTAWAAFTGQDLLSKNGNPLFYSDSLLMPIVGSPLPFSGVYLPNVSTDIAGVQRNAMPSIGAYENTFSNTLPNVVTSVNVENLTQFTANTKGEIISQGGSRIIFKGMLLSVAPYPTLNTPLALKVENGPGLGDIYANWTNLQQQRTYYVRAYATNQSGVSYGSDVSFTTLPIYYAPMVVSNVASNITKNSVHVSGEVKDDYYSPITERGFIWGTNSNISLKLNNILGKISVGKTNNTYVNSFDATISGLNSFTDYYFKAYAINAIDTSHGIGVSFTTLSDGYQVSGTVKYAQYTASMTSKNMYLSGSKKMPFAPWVKLMQNGVKVDSVMADSITGAFSFSGVANGEYTLTFDENHSWLTSPSTKAYQLNIQDVALIRQCAAQVRNFDSLQIKAVNVNLDYKNGKPYFNVQDVSFIRMKNGGVNPLPTQWMMPNWVYGIETSPCNATSDIPAVLKTDMTITVNGSNQSFIIRCISAADVNGQ